MKKLMVIVALVSVLTAAALPVFACGGEKFNREVYIDIMEKAVLAYTPEQIKEYTEKVDAEGLTEHGFPRLTSNMGIVIAHGRLTQLKGQFIKMMDICVREVPMVKPRQLQKKDNKSGSAGNDFSVREMVSCILECEQSGAFPKELTDAWRNGLRDCAPSDLYRMYELGGKKGHNWAVYAAASECARVFAGIGGDAQWADTWIGDQCRHFDRNGMYRDPNEPINYDIVTRLQFMAALSYGYDGPSRGALEEQLLKSALPTLQMQSVTGEFPFGGRSNQMLFNDTVQAAVCEFYATWYAQMGDAAMASRFKAAAKRAIEGLHYWLDQQPVRHVKNRFPTETQFGCEGYAYFDKYMVTMGSFAYLAYRFSEDSIKPAKAFEPASTFVMSKHFHRVVMNAADYTAEFELNAQEDYDSNGLGRLQRRGAPPVIVLSCPCPTAKRHYKSDIKSLGPLSIAPCWEKYEVVSATTGKIVLTDGANVWACTLGKKGIDMALTGEGTQMLTIPVLEFDGETHPDISADEHSIVVRFGGWKAVYSSPDGIISNTGKLYANRSGHLLRYEASASGTLTVNIRIEKD